MLGDDIMPNEVPLTKCLIDVYEKTGLGAVATTRVSEKVTNRFGIIDIEEELNDNLFKIKHLVEKPAPDEAPSNLGIIGRYLLTPDVFDVLRKLEPDVGNEIQLTDALEELNQNSPLVAYEYKGRRFDVGDKYGMLLANIEMGLVHVETFHKMREYVISLVKIMMNFHENSEFS